MTQILQAIEQATAVLAGVARVDRAGLSDDELVAVMRAEEAAGRFIDTARVLSAAEVAERSRYELGAEGLSMRFGERKPVNLIEQITRVSQREASRRVRVGSEIRPRLSLLGEGMPPQRPIVAEAMINGLIGLDSAQAIVASMKQAESGSLATLDNMDAAELALVRQATIDSADLVADAARTWRDALDPDGIEPRYEEIEQHQVVTIGREHNGIRDYTIHAGPVLAAALDAALEESMHPAAGPRFLSAEQLAAAEVEFVESHGTMIERVVDPRPFGRRQYDILEAVFLAGLAATREGAPEFRTIGMITAVISEADLEAGTGYGIIEGVDEVIPGRVIKQLACRAGFSTTTVAPTRSSSGVTRPGRYFTLTDRRCIIARDGDRCMAKGCRKRASRTHAHHVVFYARGGPTSVDNGVLLCPAHHHALHQRAFEIKMIAGMPFIRDRVDFLDDNAWWPASRNRLRGPTRP